MIAAYAAWTGGILTAMSLATLTAGLALGRVSNTHNDPGSRQPHHTSNLKEPK